MAFKLFKFHAYGQGKRKLNPLSVRVFFTSYDRRNVGQVRCSCVLT